MTIEIVDFPINSMVIFHSYVSLPEGMIKMYYHVLSNMYIFQLYIYNLVIYKYVNYKYIIYTYIYLYISYHTGISIGHKGYRDFFPLWGWNRFGPMLFAIKSQCHRGYVLTKKGSRIITKILVILCFHQNRYNTNVSPKYEFTIYHPI